MNGATFEEWLKQVRVALDGMRDQPLIEDEPGQFERWYENGVTPREAAILSLWDDGFEFMDADTDFDMWDCYLNPGESHLTQF
jgi:hypothetical protein